MKKLFALCLALAMALTLCACGETPTGTAPGGSQSGAAGSAAASAKEEMLAKAETLDCKAFYDDYKSNKVRFMEEHEGKEQVYIINGGVYAIEADHITVENLILVDVYLPEEDIMALEMDQDLSVVGVLGNIREIEEDSSFGFMNTRLAVDLNPAYVEKDVYSRTGTIHIFKVLEPTGPSAMKERRIVQLVSNYNGRTSTATLDLSPEQAESLTEGQEVTAEGRLFWYDSDELDSASDFLMKDVIIK